MEAEMRGIFGLNIDEMSGIFGLNIDEMSGIFRLNIEQDLNKLSPKYLAFGKFIYSKYFRA